MKKSETTAQKTASKKQAAPKTVSAYLARVPRPARSVLAKLRSAVRSCVPKNAVEVISYGIPAFKTDKVLVWFAAFSDHCSLFPTAAIIEKFENELKPYSTSRGTIHFRLNKPLPMTLIKKIVKARVKSSSPR